MAIFPDAHYGFRYVLTQLCAYLHIFETEYALIRMFLNESDANGALIKTLQTGETLEPKFSVQMGQVYPVLDSGHSHSFR